MSRRIGRGDFARNNIFYATLYPLQPLNLFAHAAGDKPLSYGVLELNKFPAKTKLSLVFRKCINYCGNVINLH